LKTSCRNTQVIKSARAEDRRRRAQQGHYMEGLRLGSALAKRALMTAALMSVRANRRIERGNDPKARRAGSIAPAAAARRLTLKNTAEPAKLPLGPPGDKFRHDLARGFHGTS
jgi:hypothetical protein